MPKRKGVIILGIGGAGCNVLRGLGDFNSSKIQLWSLDSDLSYLKRSLSPYKLVLTPNTLDRDSLKKIRPFFASSKIVIFIAGLGGNTGSSATPILAQLAREAGAKTMAIVFFPFRFEGPDRKAIAQDTINKLKDSVDILKVIQNSLFFDRAPSNLDLKSAFAFIDKHVEEEIRNRI